MTLSWRIVGASLVVLGCADAEPTAQSSDDTGTSAGTSAESADSTTEAVSPDGTSTTAESAESTTTGTPQECAIAEPLPPGDHERMLEHDGQMRRFIVHVPPSQGSVAPLLVNMHGLLGTPEQQIQWSEMNATSDPRGWIVVYPAGIANSWNAGICCGDASADAVDDVGFLRAMLDDVASIACVDRRRVYATGMSNGGHMSYRLACDAADLFAAIAPVAGAMRVTECAPARPVPVLAFHGVQDLIVPYVDDVASIDGWVTTDGCDPEPAQEDFTGGNCRTWSGCEDGSSVGLCTLDPMGHCWPGGDASLCFAILGAHSEAVDADAEMLDFFDEHALP